MRMSTCPPLVDESEYSSYTYRLAIQQRLSALRAMEEWVQNQSVETSQSGIFELQPPTVDDPQESKQGPAFSSANYLEYSTPTVPPFYDANNQLREGTLQQPTLGSATHYMNSSDISWAMPLPHAPAVRMPEPAPRSVPVLALRQQQEHQVLATDQTTTQPPASIVTGQTQLLSPTDKSTKRELSPSSDKLGARTIIGKAVERTYGHFRDSDMAFVLDVKHYCIEGSMSAANFSRSILRQGLSCKKIVVAIILYWRGQVPRTEVLRWKSAVERATRTLDNKK